MYNGPGFDCRGLLFQRMSYLWFKPSHPEKCLFLHDERVYDKLKHLILITNPVNMPRAIRE